MKPFEVVRGRAGFLMQANIDTDVIIRIERLTSGKQEEIGRYALEVLRYSKDGTENSEFIFNQPKYRDAPILIAGRNFGCGSSREGAVVALMGLGIRCVIAESFGDIFYSNCFQNGMLPIRLPGSAVQQLATEANDLDQPFTVDLLESKISTPSGRTIVFTIDALRREALLAGLDDIGLTLSSQKSILDWQGLDRAERPWIWSVHDRAAWEDDRARSSAFDATPMSGSGDVRSECG